MPKISEFFGIQIYMYYDDHGPPHFHAQYGEYEAVIRIGDLSVAGGRLPPRALGLVMEWAALRGPELDEAWKRAAAMEPLQRIEPLR